MKIINFFIGVTLLLSCKNEGEKNSFKKNNEMNSAIEKVYMLNHEIGFPAEILINDLICEIDLEENPFSPSMLNQFILNKGKQFLKIKIISPFIMSKGLIKAENIKKLNEDLAIYSIERKGEVIINHKLIKKIDFPEIEQPVPFIEYEWEFEAALPFELEGWKNSENLENWDAKVLEKKVLDKFTELRELLNTGNGEDFVKELDFANKEFFIANYFSEKQKQEYTANLIATYSEHKDIMPVIENYRVRIMGDGKVVTLENLGKYKGQSVLTAENKEKDVLYLNYVMLHKPKNSDDFKIVRINSQMTSID